MAADPQASRRISARLGLSLATLALVLAGLAFALASPPADAFGDVQRAGGITYVTEHYNVLPGRTKVLASSCPRRTHVLGGGEGDSFAGYGQDYATASFPFDGSDADSQPDDGWKAQITTYDQDVGIVIYAVCAKIMPHYVADRWQIAPIGFINKAVFCGGDREVLSGGSRNPVSVRVTKSLVHDGGPTNDQWQLSLENAVDAAYHVTGFAICAHLPAGIHVSYPNGATAFPIAPGDDAVGSIDCPVGAPHAIGGGYYSGGFSFLSLRRVWDQPYPAQGQTPDSWKVRLEYTGFSNEASFEVWNTCLPDLS